MKPYSRKFGCEFEFSSNFLEMAQFVPEIIEDVYGTNCLVVRNYNFRSTENKIWHLKRDWSTSCELVTPISKFSDLQQIGKVVDAVYEAGAKTTTADSLHIHMQADDIPEVNILAAWLRIEKPLSRCFPRHRRENSYCAKLMTHYKNTKSMPALYYRRAKEVSSEHHSAMSLNYYEKRGTVEFRLQEGCLDGETVKMFVRFYMHFLYYASTIDGLDVLCSPNQIILRPGKMLDTLHIFDARLRNFIYSRWKCYAAA